MNNLLEVPLRQSKPIDLGEELVAIIKRDYFQTPSTFEADLRTITQVRNDITAITPATVAEKDISLVKTYYHYLSILINKFPDDSVEFAWYGTLAYGPSGPTKSRAFKVEQLNTVFQLGSIYCHLGLQQSRHTDEGLKKACGYFQQAAGCFEYMLTFEPDSRVPYDLQGDTIKCLKFLMLAQAQETIWQKAVSNSMKDSVIAKLSIQTSDYYATALAHGNGSDYIKLEWINHMTVKKYHFKAAAHFRTAIAYQDSFQYGEQVGSLKLAYESCETALKSKKYVGEFVVEELMGLTDAIKTTLRVAERDNDLIYLKIVPSEKDLKPIVGASMVKPSVPDLAENSNGGDDLFSDLLPHIIIQVAQAFRERIESYLKDNIFDPIRSLNNMATNFLTERNLPASIDSIQKPENLPDSIVQHSQEITSIGGTQIIDESIDEINKLMVQSTNLLDECNKRLALDAEEDNLLRQNYGTQLWARPAGETSGDELRTKISMMSAYLEQAKSGDAMVRQKYNDIRPYLEVYCGGFQSLSVFVPNSKYTELEPGVATTVSELRRLVNEIRELEDVRKQFVQEVEIKSRDNTVLPMVIEEYKRTKSSNGTIDERSFEHVYENYIHIFSDQLSYIQTSKQHQITLEQKIDAANKSFLREVANVVNESQQRRGEVLQTLETAYSKYLEVLSNLSEGSSFYGDFISKGTQILKECDNFLHQRRIEGRELEERIQRQISGGPPPPDFTDDSVCPKSRYPQ